MAETQVGTPAFTMAPLAAEKEGMGPPCREARPAPTRRSLPGRRPSRSSAPPPSACGGGRSPVSLSGDPASQEFWGVPPQAACSSVSQASTSAAPAGTPSRAPATSTFRPEGAGGGGEQVPDVRRAPRQHQHAGGTGLHQQWAGTGREATLVTCSLIHTFTHSSVSQSVC